MRIVITAAAALLIAATVRADGAADAIAAVPNVAARPEPKLDDIPDYDLPMYEELPVDSPELPVRDDSADNLRPVDDTIADLDVPQAADGTAAKPKGGPEEQAIPYNDLPDEREQSVRRHNRRDPRDSRRHPEELMDPAQGRPEGSEHHRHWGRHGGPRPRDEEGHPESRPEVRPRQDGNEDDRERDMEDGRERRDHHSRREHHKSHHRSHHSVPSIQDASIGWPFRHHRGEQNSRRWCRRAVVGGFVLATVASIVLFFKNRRLRRRIAELERQHDFQAYIQVQDDSSALDPADKKAGAAAVEV